MKQAILEIIEAGEQLIQQAIEAIRHHREAEVAGKSPNELKRLLLLADSLYQAVPTITPERLQMDQRHCIRTAECR